MNPKSPSPERPGSHETKKRPTQEEIRTALFLVSSLPRETLPEEGGTGFVYFTLHVLFECLKNKDHLAKALFLDKTEATGDKWKIFLSDNMVLIDQINEILNDKEKYDLAFEVYCKLASVDPEAARDFEEKAELQEIDESIARRLNPLLNQAADAMREVGIDPTIF